MYLKIVNYNSYIQWCVFFYNGVVFSTEEIKKNKADIKELGHIYILNRLSHTQFCPIFVPNELLACVSSPT